MDLRACLVAHMGLAWFASMGLAHPSQAERMQALLFGSLHIGSLVFEEMLFGCSHEYKSCNTNVPK